MTKASLIRDIVARGYNAKSPNTLRRWSLEQLQALLASMPALEQVPVTGNHSVTSPITQEMTAYVDAIPVTLESVTVPGNQVTVPTDRELYASALCVQPAPVIAPPVVSGLERWLALCLAPWTFALKFAGIA